MTTFCLTCGLPLDPQFRKFNNRFEGKEGKGRVFCNERCRKVWAKAKHHKNPPKYGVAAF